MNRMSDGPAMVLSPPQDHAFVQFPSAQSKFDPVSNDTFRTYAANSGPSFTNGLSTNAYIPKPSRKRSRDDAEFEEAMNAPIEPPAPAPAPEPEEEPIYGEGMVLLNPRTGMGVSPESQTGTWYEEKVEDSIVAAPPVSSKSTAGLSDVQGRKSQRLDPSAPGLDDIALSSMHQRLQNTTDDDNRRVLTSGSNSTPNGPLVDDATCLLGISWQRVGGEDDDMAPAVRGWEKYINNQYSANLQDCQITMKSRALNAYLVAARPVTFAGTANTAYYLFSEDLDQGRLVGSTWEACVKNLQSSPVLFEGPEVLRAADKRSDSMDNAAPLGTNAMEAGVPLLQSLSAQPVGGLGGLNGGVGTGMEIDS